MQSSAETELRPQLSVDAQPLGILLTSPWLTTTCSDLLMLDSSFSSFSTIPTGFRNSTDSYKCISDSEEEQGEILYLPLTQIQEPLQVSH